MPYKDPEKQRQAQLDYSRRRADFYRNRSKKRRVEMRAWFDKIKEGLECETCGETHPATFDFHHPDPTQKDFSVSEAISRFGKKEKILVEMEKCMVLCSNCHRKLHWKFRHETEEISSHPV